MQEQEPKQATSVFVPSGNPYGQWGQVGQQPQQINFQAQMMNQATDALKQQAAQLLMQQIVNQIASEDVLEEKIKEEQAKDQEISCLARLLEPFNLEYYQPYFKDLTSDLVIEKMKAAFFPLKATFFEIQGGKPDFYGPFWIYCSLIFAIAASGNIAGYLNTPSNMVFQYNFDYVPTATTLIFSVGILVPIILCFIMKLFGSEVNYKKALCIYGYASACIIPVTIGCSIPNPQLQWALIIYAIVNSSLFLITNYFTELEKYIQNRRYIVMWFIGGAQVFLLLIYKIYFFNYVYMPKQSGNILDQNSMIHLHHKKHINHQ